MGIKLNLISEQVKKVSIRAIIGMSIIYLTYGMFVLLIYKAVPEQNKDVVLLAAGYIMAKFGTVVDWNFGTSKSEADKNKVEAIKDAPPAP